nr:hypothetical protein [Tanacetum cinerariifolium]
DGHAGARRNALLRHVGCGAISSGTVQLRLLGPDSAWRQKTSGAQNMSGGLEWRLHVLRWQRLWISSCCASRRD